MLNTSDKSDNSCHDNTNCIPPSTDECGTDGSSSSSSCISEESDSICWSDSDLTDGNSLEPKKMKLDFVDHEISPHEQLHRAIRFHDCGRVHKLLEDGVQPCTAYKNSSSCFFLAYESKFILQKLLALKPSGINCQNSDGSTMLMLSTNNESIFKFLCKYKPDVNLLNDFGDNILHQTLKNCIQFDPSKLKRFLKLGVDVNAADATGDTALTLAIKVGRNANIIEMLLDQGATLPPPDEDGKTIVIHAIKNDKTILRDKVEVLKILFKHGADASAKDKDGHNAMYYIISECIMRYRSSVIDVKSLEKIIILLLKRNCEVQGLDQAHEILEIISTCDFFPHRIPVRYHVISALVRQQLSIELLKKLLKRGVYSRTNPNALSPFSACLIQSILPKRRKTQQSGQRIIDTAKEMILLGADVSQRIWHELSCPGYTEPLEYEHRTRAEYQAAVARELDIPDALFFVANMRISYSGYLESKNFLACKMNIAVEELLRLLLRFWPHPPLLLMLLRVDPVWCPSLITTSVIDSNSRTRICFMMKILAKIGGPLPLGTRYYTILKSALQRMADRNDLWKPILNILLSEPDGEIPSLLNLSHAAFRATVKKTCLTGLDFSEYRVLCQGEMVPLPKKIINLLEFRV